MVKYEERVVCIIDVVSDFVFRIGVCVDGSVANIFGDVQANSSLSLF